MKPNTVGRVTGLFPQTQPQSKPSTQAGFLAGTIVLTQDGEMPVEFISAGDRLITRDAGLVTVEQVSKACHIGRAISFAAGSLGHTRPDQDLTLPAGQQVLIRDWRAQAMFGQPRALVSASDLIDGEFIRDLGLQTMVLHQLHLNNPHVLYAGGLELSSELDTSAIALRPAA